MAGKQPNSGKILLAEPFLSDPYFKRSVVLLCEHHEEGSLGFILNKSIDMKINELINDFPKFDSAIYYGGPVQTDTIHYIHNVGDLLDDSQKIVEGVYWGGNYDKLKYLIKSDLISPNNIRFFVGYSGWSGGQLGEELNTGSWVMGEMDANYVFKLPPSGLWSLAMANKGSTFSVISQMPEGTILN